MQSNPNRSNIAVALILGSLAWNPGLAQQTPTSDSGLKGRGTAGTTYLIQDIKEKNALFVAEFKVPIAELTPAPAAPVSITYPTTDRANAGPKEMMNLLMLSVPAASLRPGQLVVHTNYVILRRNAPPGPSPAAAIDEAIHQPVGESPESLRAVYGVPPGAGSGAVAIVDAFAYPEADSDLDTFSKQFGLPSCRENKNDEHTGCLQKYPQTADHKEDISGFAVNCGWAGESALDLQAVHSIAPHAKLIYVQARSDSYDDLMAALKIAQQAIASAGGGSISMSWGGQEFPTEKDFDSKFTRGAIYFASTGDHGGDLLYPAVSPNVIAVGGTTLMRTQSGDLAGQTSWDSGGGGVSQYEPAPPFQAGIENVTPGSRNVPDISADANPNSGMAVYAKVPKETCVDHPRPEQELNGWLQIGGTSLAAPLLAAMTNASGHKRTSVADELSVLYANRKNANRIKDISVETAPAGGNHVRVGYDLVTGVGTPASMSFDEDVPNEAAGH